MAELPRCFIGFDSDGTFRVAVKVHVPKNRGISPIRMMQLQRIGLEFYEVFTDYQVPHETLTEKLSREYIADSGLN